MIEYLLLLGRNKKLYNSSLSKERYNAIIKFFFAVCNLIYWICVCVARPSPAPRVEPVQQVAPATGEGDKFNRSVPFARNFFNYPDNCQIFVGNLPNGMEENELKEFFETFGKVIDVRIQRKNMNYNVPVSN